MTVADNPPSTADVTGPIDDAFDIMLVGWSFVRSKLLMTALDLGLFEELSKEPGTVEHITSRLGLHPRGSRDFLDALAALGVEIRWGRFALWGAVAAVPTVALATLVL